MVDEYGEEDLEIDQEFNAEDQKDLQDEIYGDQAPAYKEKDDLWSLFWKVISRTDSSKVANLNKQELGMLNISVRDCIKIARIGETLGHPGFAKFFMQQSEITLSTSCSRDAHLLNLFVSQKKFSTKSKAEGNTDNLLNQPKKKRSFLNR